MNNVLFEPPVERGHLSLILNKALLSCLALDRSIGCTVARLIGLALLVPCLEKIINRVVFLWRVCSESLFQYKIIALLLLCFRHCLGCVVYCCWPYALRTTAFAKYGGHQSRLLQLLLTLAVAYTNLVKLRIIAAACLERRSSNVARRRAKLHVVHYDRTLSLTLSAAVLRVQNVLACLSSPEEIFHRLEKFCRRGLLLLVLENSVAQ